MRQECCGGHAGSGEAMHVWGQIDNMSQYLPLNLSVNLNNKVFKKLGGSRGFFSEVGC